MAIYPPDSGEHRRTPGQTHRPGSPLAASTSQRSWRPFAAALALLVLFGITCAAFVWTAPGQRVDSMFLPQAPGSIGPRTGEFGGAAETVLSTLGSPMMFVILLAVAIAASALTHRGLAGLFGIVAAGLAIVTASVFKEVMLRPDLGLVGSTTHNSFPSGHTTAATAVVCAVLIALPRLARRWCVVPGAVYVALVGGATMIAGWHRLSDVLGGVLLATAMACLAVAARRALRGRRTRGNP